MGNEAASMVRHAFSQSKENPLTLKRKALVKDLLNLPWVRSLDPKTRQKVIRDRLRRLVPKAQPKPVEDHIRRRKRKLPKPSARRVRGPDKPSTHIPFQIKTVYGSAHNVLTSGYSAGHLWDGHTTVTDTIQPVRDTYLTSWSSVNGVKDIKHPHPHRFTISEDGYFYGTKSNLDRFGNGNVTSGWNLTGAAAPLIDLDYDVSTYNEALGRLYTSIRGDLDLSIDLAESHQALRMLGSGARRLAIFRRQALSVVSQLYEGMASFSKTMRKIKRARPRDAGNLWLEWTYGWKPLANSIYQTASKLMLEPNGPLSTYAEGKARFSQDLKTVTGTGGTGGGVRVTTVTKNQYRCRIRARFAFTQSAVDSLAGFTSLNPVSIAWELTPYSFVVDWFVDVGGYMRNLETALLYRMNFRDGYISEGWMSENYVTRFYYSDSGTSISTEDSHATSRKVGFRRTILGSIPFPRAPRFDPKLGTSRLLSAASLLGQLIPDRRNDGKWVRPPHFK